MRFENKLSQLEKNRVNVSSIRESHEEFIKNNNIIFKTTANV